MAMEDAARNVLSMLPSDFLVGSLSTRQLAKDLFEIQITGKRVGRGLTVECRCVPRLPKGQYCSIFSQPSTIIWTMPCIRLGFCNGELRPHFEILLENHSNTTEIVAPEAISAGKMVHLAGTFDGTQLRLYVDGKVVAERPTTGILVTPTQNARAAIGSRSANDPGDYYHGKLYYVRVWRIARTQEQLYKNIRTCAPPPHPNPDAQNYNDGRTLFNLAYLSREPDCVLWYAFCLGPYGLAGRPISDDGEVALATRILKAGGIPEQEQGDAVSRARKAGSTILQACDELQQIIDDPSTTEPDVLGFFRERPQAAFLLEPDQDGEIWREKQIQGYGQIDFVFRKTNGRYLAMEIESHNVPLFLKNDEFSKRFDHAIDQVERWQLGVLKHKDLAEDVLGLKGIQSPDGAVVMGRQRELANSQRNERWDERCARSSLEFLTWDHVIMRGRSLGRRLGNPELPEAEWS